MEVLKIYNSGQQHTNFGAKISSSNYLRKEVRNIADNGTLVEKSLLLNLLSIIRNDTQMTKFRMSSDILSFADKKVNYIFTINGTDKIRTQPFINPSAFRENTGDKNFINALSWFIKQHYGEDVYQKAVKNLPECMKKYLSVLKETEKQLRTGIRDVLDLEPREYIKSEDGKKIPVDEKGRPDKNYVC